MNRPLRVLLLTLLILVVFALAAGCAANTQALRPEVRSVEVRVPPAEAVGIEMSAGAPIPPQAEAPFSVVDGDRGRWLTLFEVNITPSESAGPPPAPFETP